MKNMLKVLMISTMVASSLHAGGKESVETQVPTQKKLQSISEILTRFNLVALIPAVSFVNDANGMAPFIRVCPENSRVFNSLLIEEKDKALFEQRAREFVKIINKSLDSILEALTPEAVKALSTGSTKILPETEDELEYLSKKQLTNESLAAIIAEIVKLLDNPAKDIEIPLVKKLKRVFYKAERYSLDTQDNPENISLALLIQPKMKINADLLINLTNLLFNKLLEINPSEVVKGLVSEGDLVSKAKLLDTLIKKLDAFKKALTDASADVAAKSDGQKEESKFAVAETA